MIGLSFSVPGFNYDGKLGSIELLSGNTCSVQCQTWLALACNFPHSYKRTAYRI